MEALAHRTAWPALRSRMAIAGQAFSCDLSASRAYVKMSLWPEDIHAIGIRWQEDSVRLLCLTMDRDLRGGERDTLWAVA